MGVNVGPADCRIESKVCMELCWKWFQDQKNNIEAMVKVQSPKDKDLLKIAKCWKCQKCDRGAIFVDRYLSTPTSDGDTKDIVGKS